MMKATTLFVSVICAALCAAAQNESAPAFACNLKAISPAHRTRYHELLKRIRSAIRDRSAIPNGYVFKLDSEAVTLPEAAEWMSMERVCCPFLTLGISASGNQSHWLLALSGPAGVQPLLDAEFPVP